VPVTYFYLLKYNSDTAFANSRIEEMSSLFDLVFGLVCIVCVCVCVYFKGQL